MASWVTNVAIPPTMMEQKIRNDMAAADTLSGLDHCPTWFMYPKNCLPYSLEQFYQDVGYRGKWHGEDNFESCMVQELRGGSNAYLVQVWDKDRLLTSPRYYCVVETIDPSFKPSEPEPEPQNSGVGVEYVEESAPSTPTCPEHVGEVREITSSCSCEGNMKCNCNSDYVCICEHECGCHSHDEGYDPRNKPSWNTSEFVVIQQLEQIIKAAQEELRIRSSSWAGASNSARLNIIKSADFGNLMTKLANSTRGFPVPAHYPNANHPENWRCSANAADLYAGVRNQILSIKQEFEQGAYTNRSALELIQRQLGLLMDQCLCYCDYCSCNCDRCACNDHCACNADKECDGNTKTQSCNDYVCACNTESCSCDSETVVVPQPVCNTDGDFPDAGQVPVDSGYHYGY